VPHYSGVVKRWSLLRWGAGERSVWTCQFVDDAPCLAAGVQEIDGIDKFLPSSSGSSGPAVR